MNNEFFKGWNPINAYVTGNSLADASMARSKIKITYKVKAADICILEHIKEVTDSHHKLSRKSEFLKETQKSYETARLQICGKEFCSHALEKGIIPNKTKLGCKFPTDASPKEMRHFIRGYFDGDGSVSFDSWCKALQVNFRGDVPFLIQLRDYLIDNGIWSYKYKVGYSRGTGYINCKQKASVQRFAEYIYSDGGFYLPRKKEVFLKHL